MTTQEWSATLDKGQMRDNNYFMYNCENYSPRNIFILYADVYKIETWVLVKSLHCKEGEGDIFIEKNYIRGRILN